MRDFIRSLGSVLVVLAFGIDAANAGTTLTLGEVRGGGISLETIDASVEFSVTGSMLTLTVTNDSPIETSFDIVDIYFNALPNVTGMSLSSAFDGWTLGVQERADGFGTFDYALLSALGNDPAEIGPQQSLQFELEILGTGPFADTDFTTQLSEIPPGNRPALAAAKFVNGPHNGSAYAAFVPEPGTVSLLLVGIGLLTRRSRRFSG